MPAPWFGPRRYGLGWGLPLRWQGWATLALFVVGLVAARRLVFRLYGLPGYFAAVMLLIFALVVVCWLTSGPPKRGGNGPG
jgi:hypothetical protein